MSNLSMEQYSSLMSKIKNDLTLITNVQDVINFANEVSKLANQQISFLNQSAINKFKIGDPVVIKHNALKGVITKINKKTIQLLVKDKDTYKNWVVSATAISKVKGAA